MRISDWSSDVCSSDLIALKAADTIVGFGAQRGAVIIDAHQLGPIIGADVLAVLLPRIEHLLAKVQRPVEARRVVIGELALGNGLAVRLNLAADRLDFGLFVLDPNQFAAVLRAGVAVKTERIFHVSGPNLIEFRGRSLRQKKLA